MFVTRICISISVTGDSGTQGDGAAADDGDDGAELL